MDLVILKKQERTTLVYLKIHIKIGDKIAQKTKIGFMCTSLSTGPGWVEAQLLHKAAHTPNGAFGLRQMDLEEGVLNLCSF